MQGHRSKVIYNHCFVKGAKRFHDHSLGNKGSWLICGTLRTTFQPRQIKPFYFFCLIILDVLADAIIPGELIVPGSVVAEYEHDGQHSNLVTEGVVAVEDAESPHTMPGMYMDVWGLSGCEDS